MRNLILISMLAFLSSCSEGGDSKEKIVSAEIEMITPNVKQGEVARIPIDATFSIEARISEFEEESLQWSLSDEQETKEGRTGEFTSIHNNGRMKLQLSSSNEFVTAETFAWIDILGKTVTQKEEDEIGCAVCDFEGGYYVFSKNREKYNQNGMFISRFEKGQLQEKSYDADLGLILDVKRIDQNTICLLTNRYFVLINSQSGQIDKYDSDSFAKGRIIYDDAKINYIALNKNGSLCHYSRNLNGDLLVKQIIADDEAGKEITDLQWDDFNRFYFIQMDHYSNQVNTFVFEQEKQLVYSHEIERDYEYALTRSKDEMCFYYCHLDMYHTNSTTTISNFHEEDQFDLMELVHSSIDYRTEKYLHKGLKPDTRIWALGSNEEPVFISNNQIIKGKNRREPNLLFEGQSRFKIDWVQKTNEGALVLGNVQQVNEYGAYSKRYNILLKMDEKGAFQKL